MTAQRVLITAGASGIGLAIAKAFVHEGARVHIGDINEEALAQAIHFNEAISGTSCDVADPVSVENMFADVSEQLGGLDVLVNNAGIAGPTAPVADYDPAAWEAVVDVNLSGTFHVTRHAIPMLRESARGTIIVMSSIAGRFGYPNRIGYATTKWGLVGFTKTLAMELGQFGITANTIHPGAVEGARIEHVLHERAKASGRSVEEETESMLENQSIKRFVVPEDIAALAVFLAGPHARTISGQMFPIDGDSKSTQ
jgi:NAD(P)-dependent dehydrogenase (short-subunit alcohol dehydrogenase family)